jgi:hypothetical protein
MGSVTQSSCDARPAVSLRALVRVRYSQILVPWKTSTRLAGQERRTSLPCHSISRGTPTLTDKSFMADLLAILVCCAIAVNPIVQSSAVQDRFYKTNNEGLHRRAQRSQSIDGINKAFSGGYARPMSAHPSRRAQEHRLPACVRQKSTFFYSSSI